MEAVITTNHNSFKYANARQQIADALIAKGFLPELVGAFDCISEFTSIATTELAVYLEQPESVMTRQWREFVREIGGELDRDGPWK